MPVFMPPSLRLMPVADRASRQSLGVPTVAEQCRAARLVQVPSLQLSGESDRLTLAVLRRHDEHANRCGGEEQRHRPRLSREASAVRVCGARMHAAQLSGYDTIPEREPAPSVDLRLFGP